MYVQVHILYIHEVLKRNFHVEHDVARQMLLFLSYISYYVLKDRDNSLPSAGTS